MAIIKKFTVLARKREMSAADFHRHWLAVHGPLVAAMPEFWKYATRYIQNHVLAALTPAARPYDGIVTTWQRPRPDMHTGFVDEPRYFERVRPDEERFLDLSAAAIVYARERVIRHGPEAPVKWLAFFPPLVASDQAGAIQEPELPAAVRRFVRSDVVPELSRGLAEGGPALKFGSCVEAWFDSMEDAQRTVALLAAAGAADAMWWLVEEHDIRPASQAATA